MTEHNTTDLLPRTTSDHQGAPLVVAPEAANAASDDRALTPRTVASVICAHRDAALALAREAAETIARGHELARQAQEHATKAHASAAFHPRDYSQDEAYRSLFARFDAEAAVDSYRKQLDARTWVHLLSMVGVKDLMDRTALEDFDRKLASDVPEVNEEAMREMLADHLERRGFVFARGLARCFADLDGRFRSHDAFKLGARMILTNVLDGDGHLTYHQHRYAMLDDVERVFRVLDGKQGPPERSLSRVLRDERSGWGARKSKHESDYFRIHCWKNGNAHLWFTRNDLVERANRVLADYYGAVLPDAYEPDDSPADIETVSGLPSKDLAFYPTPEPVVKRMLRGVHLDGSSRVLEPSAGVGNITKIAAAKGAEVVAVELHPRRVRELEALRLPRVSVVAANFLQLPADPSFTHVLMNPPFCGTHWMQHMKHAFDFLAPGGVLVAVLPVSAELGTSKKHEAFRKWATMHARYGELRFDSLPAESFAESGTRVSTVVLRLYQRHS